MTGDNGTTRVSRVTLALMSCRTVEYRQQPQQTVAQCPREIQLEWRHKEQVRTRGQTDPQESWWEVTTVRISQGDPKDTSTSSPAQSFFHFYLYQDLTIRQAWQIHFDWHASSNQLALNHGILRSREMIYQFFLGYSYFLPLIQAFIINSHFDSQRSPSFNNQWYCHLTYEKDPKPS